MIGTYTKKISTFINGNKVRLLNTLNDTININHIPYISTYKYTDSLEKNDLLIIEYYVADYKQIDYVFGVFSEKFTVEIKIGKDNTPIKSFIIRNVCSGDHTYNIDINSLNLDYGDYWYSIQATDVFKRKSIASYHRFRVFNKNEYETKLMTNYYTVTTSDLDNYNISMSVSPDYEHMIVDIPEGTSDVYAYLQEYASTYTVPSGQYICFIPDTDKDGVFNYKQGNWFQYTEGDYIAYVKYADNYDHDIIESTALTTTIGLRNLINDKINEGYNKIVLPAGYYRVSTQDVMEIVGDNVVIDFNGSTIKSNKLNLPCNNVCSLYGYNAHIINANFEGCLFETDYADFVTEEDPNVINYYEQGHGIGICNNSFYSSYENCTVKNFNGYGIIGCIPKYVTKPFNGNYWNDYSGYKTLNNQSNWVLGDIDVDGNFIESNERLVYNTYFDVGFITQNFMSFAKYLGFGGMLGGSPYIECHMYDAQYNYLGSEVSIQFRNFLKKPNTKYVKLVAYTNVFERQGESITFPLTQLSCVTYMMCYNCYLDNIRAYNIRCVGFTPFGQDCSMINSSITYSGWAEAHQLVDAEDTWERLQDFTFLNCEVDKGVSYSSLLLCSGMNTIIDNCVCDFNQYGLARDTVLRNNKILSLEMDNDGLYFTGYPRLYNNEFNDPNAYNSFFGKIGAYDYRTDVPDKQIVINTSNTFIGCNWLSARNRCLVVRGFTFDFKDRVPQQHGTLLADYDKCVLNNLEGRVSNAHLTNCTLNNCILDIRDTFNGFSFNNSFENCIFNNCTYVNSTNIPDEDLFINCEFNN